MVKSIDVGTFCRRLPTKNVNSTPPIPDPPTKRETWWDNLTLDAIVFWAFKDLIDTQSYFSFYLVCQSKQLFKIIDRLHHPPRLHRQPMMNLSFRDSVADLLKSYSSPELNGWCDTVSSSLFKFSWAILNEIIIPAREFQRIRRSKMSNLKDAEIPWVSK